ncbi:MAG TPA: GGDEF domain-containing protein [Alphaproteobacteria bacterium]
MATLSHTAIAPGARLAGGHGVAHLAAGVARRGRPRKSELRSLLDRALAVAADAEARLAEQNARIAFLEGLSRTDELTGLLNRRGFEDELKRALARARRSGETGVLIACDVDGFKRINDTHGHAAGDDVLHRLARTIAASVREIDAVARLGGDEFAVLLTATDLRNGSKRARTLQHTLDALDHVWHGHILKAGVSLGVEPYGPNDDGADLMARSDMAMYCDKRRKVTAAFRSAAE